MKVLESLGRIVGPNELPDYFIHLGIKGIVCLSNMLLLHGARSMIVTILAKF